MLGDGGELVEGVAEAVEEEPLLVQREGGDRKVFISLMMVDLGEEEVSQRKKREGESGERTMTAMNEMKRTRKEPVSIMERYLAVEGNDKLRGRVC